MPKSVKHKGKVQKYGTLAYKKGYLKGSTSKPKKNSAMIQSDARVGKGMKSAAIKKSQTSALKKTTSKPKKSTSKGSRRMSNAHSAARFFGSPVKRKR